MLVIESTETVDGEEIPMRIEVDRALAAAGYGTTRGVGNSTSG